MNRIAAAGLKVLLAAGVTCSLAACGGSGASSVSALNLAGTWTAKTVSTQGQGSFSGTASVSQTGQGLGVNGSTMLSAIAGQVTVAQSGTSLTGSISNLKNVATSSFIGTLSGSNITITGTSACFNGTETLSVTGTITASSVQGTYTITRSAKCYPATDAGTFSATKQ